MITGTAYYSGTDKDGKTVSATLPVKPGETELEIVSNLVEAAQIRWNQVHGPDEPGHEGPER